MTNKIHLTIPNRNELPDDYFLETYGEWATITRLGRINLIHMDMPPEFIIQTRIQEIIQEHSASHCDCAICQKHKEDPLDILYLGE